MLTITAPTHTQPEDISLGDMVTFRVFADITISRIATDVRRDDEGNTTHFEYPVYAEDGSRTYHWLPINTVVSVRI